MMHRDALETHLTRLEAVCAAWPADGPPVDQAWHLIVAATEEWPHLTPAQVARVAAQWWPIIGV